MKTITITPINVDPSGMYQRSSYPKIGLYEVNGMIVYVSLQGGVFILSNVSDFPVENEANVISEEVSKGNLSEDFILKLMAITMNKEKFNELTTK